MIGKHATSQLWDNDKFVVIYHNTKVFTYDRENDTIILNTGGYFTKTTKSRINQSFDQLGINGQVYQKNYEWYCDINGKVYNFEGDSLEINL